ncbi:MAG: VWA domain-containing protein [Deltaproteobacteria bacterium]|nr:VWA domain-containing protein [Deltaproteobacteria bacterium]
MPKLAFILGLFFLEHGLIPASAQAKSTVIVEPQISNPLVLVGQPAKIFLKIGLTGILPEQEFRAPVNLAIVLDRSGSMSGRKLAQAKEAAILAVNRLTPEDTISIVVYGSTVDVIVTPRHVTNKRAIINAISSIRSYGKTALFAGVSVGAEQLRRYLDRNRVNRIILLSDGLANVGPSSPFELASLGSSLTKEGISVTTMGLGLGYNEDLMSRLAMAADGNHVFIENSNDLPRIFTLELGDVLSVVAQDVYIELKLPDYVRPLRLLGRDGLINGQNISAHLNQVIASQEKYLLLELEVKAPNVAQQKPVAEILYNYRELNGSQQSGHTTVMIEGCESPKKVENSLNKSVVAAAVELIANEQNKLALTLRDQGNIAEAHRVLKQNESYLNQQSTKLKSKRLKELEKQNAEQSNNLDEHNWGRSRKIMRDMQVKSSTQRSY